MDASKDGQRRLDAGSPEIQFRQAADLLRALAHPIRLRIIDLLKGGELCVKGLEEVLGVSQSSVSQHLSRLRYAGLIESERRGHLVCYRLAGPKAETILRAVADGLMLADRKPVRRARNVATGPREPGGGRARPSDG